MPRAQALALFAVVLLAIGPNLSEARRALQQAEQAGSTGRSEPRPVAASAAEAPAEKQDEQPASDLEKILGAVGGVIGSVLGAILPPPPNGSTSAAAVDPRAVAPAAEAAGQEPETVVITNDPQPDRDGLGINGPAPAARAGGGPGEPPVTPLTEAINSTLNGLGNAVKTVVKTVFPSLDLDGANATSTNDPNGPVGASSIPAVRPTSPSRSYDYSVASAAGQLPASAAAAGRAALTAAAAGALLLLL